MLTYYNENDPSAAFWLKSLIDAELISKGTVDDRGIEDLQADDLHEYERVHLFAGIGGWERALQLAGWEGSVWTGSCPCQPFSNAGKRQGAEDKRHLWPEMRRLIAECQPPTIFGEQVASPLGREWFAGVRADLEALGYAVGGADLCAAGVGAPHIRQRLFWVADLHGRGRQEREQTTTTTRHRRTTKSDGSIGRVADMQCKGLAIGSEHKDGQGDIREQGTTSIQDGSWSNFDVVHCSDGKARRFEPGSFPLAHGVSARVAKLRGLGNAIVPQIAAEFVRAFMESDHIFSK